MTRNLSIACLLLFVGTILLSSCSTNTNVASNGLMQKRKYRKGVHLNIFKKHDHREHSIPDSVLAGVSERNDGFDESTEFNQKFEQVRSIEETKTNRSLNEILTHKKKSVREKAFSRFSVKDPPQSISEDSHEPDIESGKGTITGKYQKRGKIALFFAWVYAIMPALAWTFGFLALPGLQLFAGLLALFAFVMALILGFGNSKYSDHARKALWLVLLALIAWIAIGLVLNFVLAVALL
ncbi:MAG: hypothetical protein Salg2KO_04310 [Salibacteraceae bacterium]